MVTLTGIEILVGERETVLVTVTRVGMTTRGVMIIAAEMTEGMTGTGIGTTGDVTTGGMGGEMNGGMRGRIPSMRRLELIRGVRTISSNRPSIAMKPDGKRRNTGKLCSHHILFLFF